MSESRWSWNFRKGLVWAIWCTIGAMMGVKDHLAMSIAFRNDYTPLIPVVGIVALAFWLGGLRRANKKQSEQEAALRERVALLQSTDKADSP